MAHQQKMCRKLQIRRSPFIEGPRMALKIFFINQKTVMLRSRIARFIRSISYIQKKMIVKHQVRDSKLTILKYYWDQTIEYLKEQNKFLKDMRLTKLLNMIATMINPLVKDKLLFLYLEKCKIIAYIAFSQWRYIYSIIYPERFRTIKIS